MMGGSGTPQNVSIECDLHVCNLHVRFVLTEIARAKFARAKFACAKIALSKIARAKFARAKFARVIWLIRFVHVLHRCEKIIQCAVKAEGAPFVSDY